MNNLAPARNRTSYLRKQHVQLEFSRVRLQALALLLTVLRNSIQFNILQSFIL